MTLALENVTLGYDRHPAVHHVSALFADGSLTALVGPNGAGKSTLLKGIVGELRPTTGRIVRPKARRAVAYLPQSAELDRSFPISVRELVALGLWAEVGPFGAVGRQRRERVEAAIAAVGLAGFEDRPIGALSGGQMQRVLFARVLLQDAEVILLDEPFAAVDRRTVDDLLLLVARWHREGRTVIAVLHDLEEVRRHFPDALLLARELVAHGPTATVLTDQHLSRARAVTERFDEAADICRRAA